MYYENGKSVAQMINKREMWVAREMVGFNENTAMRQRGDGEYVQQRERKVGFIENTAMRHRWGG